MLNIWKRAWKEKDLLRGDRVDGSAGGASSQNFVIASTSAHQDDEDFESSTRPKKRSRLGMHETLNDSVLETAEQRNTAIIISQEQSIITSLVQLLTRVVKSHRDHPSSPIKRQQTALLVVSNDASFDAYESRVLSGDPSISLLNCAIAGDDLDSEFLDGFFRNDVVIVSCDRLLRWLTRGTLSMSQLYMLMFSDVLDAQGQMMVSIRCIMENFYMVTDHMSCPRIYGFATLPTNPGESITSILQELEVSLDFKVFYLSNQELKEIPSRLRCPHEVVLTCKAVPKQPIPTLLESLKLIDPSESFCPKAFRDSREVLKELGPCPSDLVWRRTMKDFGASMPDQISTDSCISNIKQAGTANVYRGAWNKIKNWTYTLPNADPNSRGYNISPKYSTLLGVLESLTPYGDNFRGIIIARGRETALAITDLLRNLNDQPCFLHPVTWLGVEEHSSTTLQQQDTLRLFNTGVYNLLIASELDQLVGMSRVSVIICFDRTTPPAAVGRVNYSSQSHMIYIIEEKHELLGNNLERPTSSLESPASNIRWPSELAVPPTWTFPQVEPTSTASNYDDEFIDTPGDSKPTGARQYTRKNPDFWTNVKTGSMKNLFPVVILISPASGDQPYTPLAILTRQPLPNISSFNVYFSGIPAAVSIQQCAALPFKEDQLKHLYMFTLRLVRTISNKPFECSFPDMMYFIAPLSGGWTPCETVDTSIRLPTIAKFILWDLVRLAGNGYHFPLRMATLEEIDNDLQDAVIQDRSVEFTRRYYAIKVRQDLSPLSKPTDSAREEAYESILAFCKSRCKDFEGLKNEDQPLIEVTTVPVILNQLNPASRPPVLLKPPAKYLIPELCSKSVIPASTLRTALLLPSITQRIDDLLLVKELNARLFNCAISDKLLHVALCTPSSGVEYNYERLELLGDAFLKYISSVYVFIAHPTHTEGFLHVARQELISNKSLFKLASRIGLPPYIRSSVFSAKQWRPPNFTLPLSVIKDTNTSQGELAETSDVDQSVIKNQAQGTNSTFDIVEEPKTRSNSIEDSKPLVESPTEIQKSRSGQSVLKNRESSRGRRKRKREATQWLGDKAVADVAEAIIGAGYITGGQEVGLQVAKALGIPLSNINRWADFSSRLGSVNSLSSITPETIKGIQDIIGYEIENLSLLSQALTHCSIPGHDKVVSERLEFVGDAILDFMVIRHIYDREQHLSPGWLTLLKGAMVSNSALAAICVCSGLHEYLLLNSHTLNANIQEYVNNLKASQEREYQNAAAEGRSPGQFWLELAAPKVLSDIVESITGVLFVADQCSSTGVEALFANLLKPFYDRHISLKTFSQHPTKLLFEIFQQHGCRQFKAETKSKEKKTDLTLVNVLVHDVVLASAEDSDVNIAARRASLSALDALEGDPGFFVRNCDCRIGSSKMHQDTKKSDRSQKSEA